jgi:uncharacterized protein YPO0396
MKDLMTEDAVGQKMQHKGFRLDRLEIRNFGGYHLKTQIFDIGCDGAVFAGENGHGKSTALDALLLLTRSRPSFNSASTEKSADRNIESYYLGQVANLDGDDGRRRAKTLRHEGDPNVFMGILAVYRDAEGAAFTIARLLYINRAKDKSWHNITGDSELSLDRDFPTWLPAGQVSRAGAAKGYALHRDLRSYNAAIAERFGFASVDRATAAFKVFEKAIGVKQVDSVEGFVRETILPERDFESVVDSAIEEIHANSNTIRECREIRDRIARLETIISNFKNLEEIYASEGTDALRQDMIAQASARVELLRHRRRRGHQSRRLVASEQALSSVERDLSQKKADLTRLEGLIAKSDSGRLFEIKEAIDRMDSELAERTECLGGLVQAVEPLGVYLRNIDEPSWEGVGAKLSDIKADNDSRRDDLVKMIEGDKQKYDRAEEKVQKLEEQIEMMQKYSSALPAPLLRARAEIASNLGLGQDDLPFLCELVQVRAGEEAWEGVANRVLFGIGTKMLVDPTRFEDAKSLINSRHWGVRITLDAAREQGRSGRVDARALCRKLEVRQDHDFGSAVEEMLENAAFQACVTDAEFRGFRGPAVTAAGSVQRGAGRVEKNDAIRIDDRSRYILGWSVEDRREQVMTALEKAEKVRDELRETLSMTQIGIRGLQERSERVTAILGTAGWPSYNKVRLDLLEEEKVRATGELKTLENDESSQLISQRDLMKVEIEEIERSFHDLTRETTSAMTSLEHVESDINRALEAVRASAVTLRPMTREDFKFFFGLIAESEKLEGEDMANPFLWIVRDESRNADAVWEKVRVTFRRRVERHSMKIRSAEGQARSSAQEYLREFTSESRFLSRDIVGNTTDADNVRLEWRERRRRLVEDNLPSLEEKLTDISKDGSTLAMTQISIVIDDYDAAAREIIEGINRMASSTVFDPSENTFARLRLFNVESAAIMKFRRLLEDATTNAEGCSLDELWDRAMKLIEFIQEDGSVQNQQIRSEIFDLRKWFTSDIEEYRADDDGVEYQVSVKTGRDGSSGGQRERMTMLLLGAGIAQAFGCHDRVRSAVAPHLIVLDEAFMRSSEETASAAIEILSVMGLQVLAATPFSKLNAFRNNARQVFTISKKDDVSRAKPMLYSEVDAARAA